MYIMRIKYIFKATVRRLCKFIMCRQSFYIRVFKILYIDFGDVYHSAYRFYDRFSDRYDKKVFNRLFTRCGKREIYAYVLPRVYHEFAAALAVEHEIAHGQFTAVAFEHARVVHDERRGFVRDSYS